MQQPVTSPARIIFDYPGRQTRHAIGRVVARSIGALLILIGLLATVVALPAGFVTLGDIVNRFQPRPEQLFEPGFPLREVEAAFVVSLFVTITGLRYGRRLVRGRRTSVLFLRRFGYDESMQAVTFAVVHTIGVAWRLVTLDDAEIAPVGVDGTSRFVFRSGERIVRLANFLRLATIWLFQFAIYGTLIVVAVQVAVVWPDWRRLMADRTLDPYFAILSTVFEGDIPSRFFAPTLPGAFAVLATAGLVGFVGLMASMVVALAMLPLLGFVTMASSAADAVRKAEKEKVGTISHPFQIARVADEVSQQGKETFAPRLVVLRVATAVWRPTVSALAAVTSATIIDISEPTENLAWEVLELQRFDAAGCIFIGDHARIQAWVEADPGSLPPGSIHGTVARLIGGRKVLAYTVSRRGMRRFARALYGMLLSLPAHDRTV